MCGILGTIPSTEVNFFKKSLDTLFYRGSDDFGVECIDNDITLGHRRLTIVDWIQGDLKEWFLDTVHEQSFLESELVNNPRQLQREIIKIANKTNNLFAHGEIVWKMLTPLIWEKSVIKRVY